MQSLLLFLLQHSLQRSKSKKIQKAKNYTTALSSRQIDTALPATVLMGTVSTLIRMRFSRNASESANRIMKKSNENHKSWYIHQREMSFSGNRSENVRNNWDFEDFMVLETMPFSRPSSQSRPESSGLHRTWWCRPLNRQKTHHHRLPMSDRLERLDHHQTL